jgi:2-C-methyl-D-erythritol 2,4-cyclodiphosphate synthase
MMSIDSYRDRPLVLGGVTIPYHLGLLGHSDADVLVHAACDAILGAAGMGDIGSHFPDHSPAFKGVYSITLLSRCGDLLRENGYKLVNLDATIFAQSPKVMPYAEDMVRTMSRALKVESRSDQHQGHHDGRARFHRPRRRHCSQLCRIG